MIYFLSIIIVFLIIICHRLFSNARYWRSRCSKMEIVLNEHRKYAGEKISYDLENYFKNTEVTRNVIKWNGDNKATIKIGNDDILVEVEIEKYDFLVALEKAYYLFKEQLDKKGLKK